MKTEPHITSILGPILQELSPRWKHSGLRIQETQVFDAAPTLVPDLLIHPEGYAPVVVEAKFERQKSDLESQAQGRQGLLIGGEKVETVVMVTYPSYWTGKTDESVRNLLRSSDPCLKWAMWSHAGRIPSQGWADTSLGELADILEIASVSATKLHNAAAKLSQAVRIAGKEIESTNRAAKLSEILRQHHDPTASLAQSSRMAAMLILNAFIFQYVLSEQISKVPTVESVRTQQVQLSDGSVEIRPSVSSVRAAWEQILKINWLPIFDIAKQLVLELPSTRAPQILHQTAHGAEQIVSVNLGSVQDIAGQMFGRLVTDRDLLKAHYTRVEAAVLLAELGVSLMDNSGWGNRDNVTNLRIADFACGTGMLLSAVYRRIISRVRRAGINDRDIHSKMIEQVFFGMDVLPSAAHLTAMSLSSVHPDIVYQGSNIHLVPLGCQPGPNGSIIVKLGSLEMLDDKTGAQSLFGRPSDLQVSATDDRIVQGDYLVKVDAKTCDLIIMNPPYGRATKHSRIGAEHAGVTRDLIPPFAAFGSSPEDQKEMSDRLKKLSSKTVSPRAGHGNVGLGSYFFDLAHAKLRPGGVLAIILPLTAATGKDWGGMRDLLVSHYDNISFIGLAGATNEERQFSADTGLAELLLIAKKRTSPRSGHETPPQVRWVTLYRRPGTEVEGIIDAKLITALCPAHGETAHLQFGEDIKGRVVTAGISDGGLLAIRADNVLDAAMGIVNGSVRLQRFQPIAIPIARLGDLGRRGPYHLDVATHRNLQGSQTQRAPFFIDDPPALTGTDPFPLLWAHDATSGRESKLEVWPDHSGTIRPGKQEQARTIFQDHAVRFHINQDFDLGSQRLAACITPKVTLGGTAWPGYKLHDTAYEHFLALWMNTTLGLISFWVTGSRQQKRRSRITVTRQSNIPVYDPRTLTQRQLYEASDVYDQVKILEFKPANQAYKDANREYLDRTVLCDLLGIHTAGGVDEDGFMEALGIVRAAWCDDPHIKRK